jgi:glycosyltransferase involved in cell wall biosynthesis
VRDEDDWTFLSDRIAMLSPFPPEPDGIARYAEQLSAYLRERGRDVKRVGLRGRGGGDVLVDPYATGGLLRALNPTRGREVVVHWFSTYYVEGRLPGRVGRWVALGILLRLRQATVLFHEPDDERHSGARGIRRAGLLLEERARAFAWSAPFRPAFHTDWERDRFERRFAGGRRSPSRVVAHGAGFRAATSADTSAARTRLGLPDSAPLFLCIGFLSERKGFDRAIAAFTDAAPADAVMYVVGAPVSGDARSARYVDRLRSLARADARVRLVVDYVDDATFDLWLSAADVLLVPYEAAASSGVVPRAHLFDTRVVSTRVGGLVEQLQPDDVAVGDDHELREAIARLAAGASAGERPAAPPSP